MTRFPKTHLYLDQYTGKELAVYDPRVDWGDTILDWLVPLHDGKAFGMTGRVIVMLEGLIPLLLFVTGFLRWNQKRVLRNSAREKRIAHLARGTCIPLNSGQISSAETCINHVTDHK